MCPCVKFGGLLLADESASVVNPTLLLSNRNSPFYIDQSLRQGKCTCAFDLGRTPASSIACAVIKSPSPAEGKRHILGIDRFIF
jgi:hypothetical protein